MKSIGGISIRKQQKKHVFSYWNQVIIIIICIIYTGNQTASSEFCRHSYARSRW